MVAAAATGRGPAWFRDAVSTPVETWRIGAAGAALQLRAWGDPGAPGVVLVHGVAAHSRWWDHIGPGLAAAGLRVTAMDLSGHGDSGRRGRYGIEMWSDEVLEVTGRASSGRSPVIVGHSLGGLVGLVAATRDGPPCRVIAIDSATLPADPARDRSRARVAARPPTVYSAPGLAVERFRPRPDQPCLDFIRERVAWTGLREVPGGWVWKCDPRVFDRPTLGLADLRAARCPVDLVGCGNGRLTPEVTSAMLARLGPGARVTGLPDAGHHPMLDRPRELVATLLELLIPEGADR